jgi:hypothetical protein
VALKDMNRAFKRNRDAEIEHAPVTVELPLAEDVAPRVAAASGERTYQVRRGFPRLMEADFPTGVGDVNVAVSLAACEAFAAPVSGMLKAVAGDAKKRQGRPCIRNRILPASGRTGG